MEIGKEIKQKKFESHISKVFINLFYTSNLFKQSLNEIMKQNNLQIQHFNILRIIRGRYPNSINPGDIKEVILDKGRDLTRLLDKLEKLELIHRCNNKKNRRKMDITLTEKGLNITNVLSNQVSKWQNDNNHLTNEEAILLSDLLDKLRG